MNPRKHVFDTTFVKGIVELVRPNSLKKNQEVFFIVDNKASVILVKNVISKSTFIAENLDTKKVSTYKLDNKIRKPILIVQDNTGFEQDIDINLTPFNAERIYSNVHKEDCGFINVIDLLSSDLRFNSDGTINHKYIGKGYKRFIRLVSESKLLSFKYTNTRFKKVKNIFREPDFADNCDVFFKLENDILTISSGELKGMWKKLE